MSVTTKSRAKREPITAPATTPALNGSSKASAEGMKEIGGGKEQNRQLFETKSCSFLEEAQLVLCCKVYYSNDYM